MPPEPPIDIGLYTSSKGCYSSRGRASQQQHNSSAPATTRPLKPHAISGSRSSHLSTPIPATGSGESCRGPGCAMQASHGPPGTSSARVIRDSSAAENPRPAGLSAESQALAGSLRRLRKPGSRQRSSNSADARAETHWVFTGIIGGPVPRCRDAADQVPHRPGRRARHPALPEPRDDRAPPVSASRRGETQSGCRQRSLGTSTRAVAQPPPALPEPRDDRAPAVSASRGAETQAWRQRS